MDKYGYIGIETLLNFCENSKDHAVTPNDFMRMNRLKEPERKIGRWIHDGYDHPHGIDWCHCSICGNREGVDSVYTQVDIYPYCAKCGAIMMEVKHT